MIKSQETNEKLFVVRFRPAPKDEDEMMVAIFECVDRLFGIVRPRKVRNNERISVSHCINILKRIILIILEEVQLKCF